MNASAPDGARPACYVGLGASAGGLEALDAFFDAMPSDSGMAFVVIQHLSPDYKSLMAELLAKHTDMAVKRAEEGMVVEPDTVYIIPPRKNLRMFHGKLLLSDQERNERGINLPIDVFFSSLAEDQGERAVGIVLSGTGSDGARGIRSIKEAGGMVLVQTDDSARFDGMPRAAVATGLADFVLPVHEMPARLTAFATHPYLAQPAQTSPLLLDEDRLARIFAMLREQTRVDFTFYKQSTIVRRIERRMTVNQIQELSDYVAFMENRRSEVAALYRELLIGVTSFYRDPAVWTDLAERHLAGIFTNRESKDVRMWVAGCSTGEEAYTLAMVCADWMEQYGERFDVKIFATDIDREAITRAGAGVYPEAVAADLTARQLTKYFSRHGDRVQIVRSIREMVVFAQHNLLTDPPFTNLDLVSCRNLLIYLQPVLQQKVIDAFNFSLNPGGILMLGTSETAGDVGQHFDTLDPRQKLYRSRGRSRHALGGELTRHSPRWPTAGSRLLGQRAQAGLRDEERLIDRLLGTLAEDCVPAAVVVNEQFEVLHILGDTSGYLKLPPGKVLNDLTRMVNDELSIPMATGLRKVFGDGREIRYTNVRIARGDVAVALDLRMRLLKGRKGQEPLAVVFLEERRDSRPVVFEAAGDSYDASAATEQRIRDLEQELQFNRENLQATIEELETSNEELQATNEELLASNEELQSTNEELQSVNEELHTVNAEHQQKIVELTELNNDLDNLLSNSHIYTLFLDENLDVRKFTPDLDAVFPIIRSDVGRPFEHLRHRIIGIDPLAVVREVAETQAPREVEVETAEGAWFLMRVLPYRIAEGLSSGIVLTLVDITSLKATRRELIASERRFARLFETLNEGVVYQDADGRITDANQAAQDILGLSLDELTGRTSLHPDWCALRPDGRPYPGDQHPAMRTLRTGQPINNELMGVYNPRQERTNWLLVSTMPLAHGPDGAVSEVYARFELIDDQTASCLRRREDAT
ncbi:MAG: chemotaxis protein CheB [Candidatus Krumholzibacteriia bacterium]